MKELNQLREAPKSFPILILNKHLDVMDELLFNDSSHVPNKVFIFNKGLYISPIYPYDLDLKEDMLVFVLLKLKL